MSIEFLVMPERCEDCAYRAGTRANLCERTQLKARLCLEAKDPFYCHEDPNRIALCRGWSDALAARHEKGTDANEPQWRRDLKGRLADFIQDYEDAIKAGAPFDYEVELRKAALGGAA